MNQNTLKSTLQQALQYINNNQLDNAHKALLQADQSSPNNIEVYHLLSVVFGMSGDYAQSELYCKKALKINGNAALVYNNLGSTQKLQGKYDDAINSFLTTIKIQADYIEPYINLANLYLEIEAIDKAESLINKAMRIDRSNLNLNLALGNLQLKQDKTKEAIETYENILYSQPKNIDAIINLGQTYEHLGDSGKALNYYYNALKIIPNYDQSIIGISSVLEKRGDFDEAINLIKPAIETSVNVKLHIIYARIYSRLKEYSKAEKILTQAKLLFAIDVHKQELLYELGNVHDKQARYDEAFSDYTQANNINQFTFNRKATHQSFLDLKSVYTSSNLKKFPTSNNKSDQPVFIIGMPRSGTSLIEKILDSHSQVYGAGELEYIDDIIYELIPESKNSQYSDWIQDASAVELQKKAEEYLVKINLDSEGSRFISNKMPHNFLHLGLIQQLFPKAKIIHCTREPKDTVLSIYFHQFNSNHPYACDLSDLHFYYKQYNDLMDHWQSELSMPIHAINYERLIENPEFECKQLINFLNLDWEDNCLNFHENKRVINTPSYHQVSQPLYKSAVKRHQHYLKHLEGFQ